MMLKRTQMKLQFSSDARNHGRDAHVTHGRDARVTVALAILLLCSLAFGQATEPSAYEHLDALKLSATLREFGMTELLESLSAKSGTSTVPGQLVLAQLKMAQVALAKDEQQRQQRAQEAIKVLDDLIARTAKPANDEDVLRNYRLRLDRAITEGVTAADPYAERLEYFLDRAGDADKLGQLTGSALKIIDELLNAMRSQRESWAGSQDRMVSGAIWRLDELIAEARYRGSWIRFYRAMSLPPRVDGKASAQRSQLLQQTIAEVAEFTNAEDNASGVKYPSLLLAGMAARENEDFPAAMAYLQKVSVPAAGINYQLKALFERAHSMIDAGHYDEAQKFIDTEFATEGLRLAGPGNAIMVEMQSALLRSQLLEVRSQNATDKAESAQLMDSAIKVLLDFVDKHPSYRSAFMEVIAPKYEGRDVKDLSPDIQVLLAVRQFNTNTPQGRQEAAKVFEAVRQRQGVTPEAAGNSLWYLALIASADNRQADASKLFGELARNYRTHAHAKDAALNSVKSLEAIMLAQKKTPAAMGPEFVKDYAEALKTLVDGWGGSDAEIRSQYGYELGLQYDLLRQRQKAMEAFSLVEPASELYIPSRYRILTQRVELLQEGQADAAGRRKSAEALIADLRAYRERAKQYAANAPAERAKEVRAMAAQCQMLEAQLYRDVLGDAAQAIRVVEDAQKQWKDVEGVDRVAREFLIRLMLEQGQIDRAMAALQDTKGSEELLTQAILQISTRIDSLEAQTDPAAQQELQRYSKAYRDFAQQLFDSARQQNLSPEQMYPYRQALARAYEMDGDDQVKQALTMYHELDKQKPNELLNLRGLARCYRKLNEPARAMEYYNHLLDGLPDNSPDWWRIQLERLAYLVQSRPTDRQAMQDVLLQIRLLRDSRGEKAAAYEQLGQIEAHAQAALGGPASEPAKAP